MFPLSPARTFTFRLCLSLLVRTHAHHERGFGFAFGCSSLGPQCNRFPEARPHYRPVGLAITCEAFDSIYPRVCAPQQKPQCAAASALAMVLGACVLSVYPPPTTLRPRRESYRDRVRRSRFLTADDPNVESNAILDKVYRVGNTQVETRTSVRAASAAANSVYRQDQGGDSCKE